MMSTSASYLETVLINTYNPSQELRVQAEVALAEYLKLSGSCYNLLLLVGNRELHRDLRQASEILLKNKLRSFWTDSDGLSMTEDEKHQFKNMIYEIILVEADNSIRGLLAETVRTICEFEFPEKWTDLLPKLLNQIQSNDPLKMYNCLLVLRKIVKRYEFKPKDGRQILDQMIQESFPMLQQLVTALLDNNSIEAASILRVCLKIFWSSTMYALPQVSGVDVNLWFNVFGHLLQKPLPEAIEGLEPAGQPTDPDSRKIWPWWKLKKWTARILVQFIQRYGNPRHASEEYKSFAEFFRSHTAVTLLGPVMNTLALRPSGKYVTDEVSRMCMTYVSAAIEMSPTYKALKPHLDFIIFQVVFPALSLSEAEMRLFKDDPQEFIRKVHDPWEDTLDPRIAATTLLQMLARYRQKDVLPRLMPFLFTVLTSYASAPPQAKNHSQKDAVLVAIAALVKVLRENKQYASHLSTFLIQHVIPEFHSPVDYLRARAYWVIDYFEESDYSEPKILRLVIDGLLSGLMDASLPVQSAAACSVRRLIEADGAKELLRPVLPQLVVRYFKIMEDCENDAVLSSLQSIVDVFGVEVKPLAVDMVTHLVGSFHQFASQAADSDDAAFSATQSLDTILSVLDAMDSQIDTLQQLEGPLVPLLGSLLAGGTGNYEYLEHCLSMMSYFTYGADVLSPAVWSLCGPLLDACQSWASDSLSDVAIPLVNYMIKDMRTFLSGQYNGKPFGQSLLQAVKSCFESDRALFVTSDEFESKQAAAILTCFISCSRDQAKGAIDQALPEIISMILHRMELAVRKELRIKLLECLLASVYYNPVLTIQSIDNTAGPNGVSIFFDSVFNNISSMTQDCTQRLVVLSFISLLSLPPSQWPEPVRINANSMFQTIIREVSVIQETAARGAAEDFEDADEEDDEEDDGLIFDDDEDEGDDEGDEQDDEDDIGVRRKGKVVTSAERLAGLEVPDGGYGEEEDCINPEDEEYRSVLERMTGEEKVKKLLYRGGERVREPGDTDDDVDEDEEINDNDDALAVTLPLELMDMAEYLVRSMTELSQTNPELIRQLQTNLNQEDNTLLQEIVRVAATGASQA